MEEELISRIRAWLDLEHHDDASVIEGARTVFALNHNRILYQTIALRPAKYEDRVRYELQKHLRRLLDGMTAADIERLRPAVESSARQTLEAGMPEPSQPDTTSDSDGVSPDPESAAQRRPSLLGRRQDHDRLPAEVQALWEKNGQRWQIIRQAYNELQQLIRTGAKPCDLYDTLELLRTTDESYRSDMAKYDAAAPAADQSDQPSEK